MRFFKYLIILIFFSSFPMERDISYYDKVRELLGYSCLGIGGLFFYSLPSPSPSNVEEVPCKRFVGAVCCSCCGLLLLRTHLKERHVE